MELPKLVDALSICSSGWKVLSIHSALPFSVLTNSMELREIEKDKIACAEKLFDQLSSSEIRYGKIDRFDTLMSLVK